MVSRRKFQSLSKENSTCLLKLLMIERAKVGFDEGEVPDLSQIVQKRIEVLKLPIKFTSTALVAITIFCDRPGAAVVLLIDALNKFKDKTVTCEMLCELYPWGFYDEKSLIDYIDNSIKKGEIEWSQIY